MLSKMKPDFRRMLVETKMDIKLAPKLIFKFNDKKVSSDVRFPSP